MDARDRRRGAGADSTAQDRGEECEGLAAGYLAERGYRILERRFHAAAGEIDLVAEKGMALVFVEVRYRRSTAFGRPDETVHGGKRQRLILSALEYVARKRQRNRRIRFDVISILATRNGPRIEHIEDAFDVEIAGNGPMLFL